MPESMIKLNGIHKSFGSQSAVDNLSLDIGKGEFVTLLGPSGCGKTTTLRMIAGFENPTAGEIILDGEPVQNKPPYLRSLNTVFQHFALFPHLNVFDNVAFGLKVKKTAKSDIRERVRQALALVQLEDFASRKPDQLSGGQKQRVAIARALVNNPKVLLLDEPLSALDQQLRKQMQVELKHLQKRLGITFIFVTHDQEEALTMSDRIAVLNNGVLEQFGTPSEIYDSPRTPFVAGFIGETNLLRGTVAKRSGNRVDVDCNGLFLAGTAQAEDCGGKDAVLLSIRPERMLLVRQPPEDSRLVQVPVTLKERIYAGAETKTIVSMAGGEELTVSENTYRLVPAQVGDRLIASWEPEHAVVLKE